MCRDGKVRTGTGRQEKGKEDRRGEDPMCIFKFSLE